MGQQDKWKNLLGGPAAAQAGHNDDPKRAPKQADHHRHRNKPDQLWSADWNAQQQPEDDNRHPLTHGHHRFAQNFAKDNRVARNWRDKNFLAEIILAVLDQRDEAERRRLKQGLGQDAGKGEDQKIIAHVLTQVGLQTAPQSNDKNQRKNQRRNQAGYVAQEFQQVSVGQR
ncbi:MAG: hypothetical protein HC875_03110 [Anaerolineales bacterium]|nr:hypothetical protein [Anaerolineales bacterium]